MGEEVSEEVTPILPISVGQSLLDGKGLTAGDPAEFGDDESISQECEPAGFSTHNYHTGKIMVSVYEAGPGKVRIEGALYDEFITILQGRLILTPDSGGEFEYQTGDSLIVPKGYVGGWDMPERYRELIVVDTEFMQEAAEVANS